MKQRRRIKPFGHNGSTIDHGIDLNYLVGWFEALIHDEEENCENSTGPKMKRLDKAQDALTLLYEVAENEESQ